MDWTTLGLYLVTALALLGSPGPGIAALVAVGRGHGWSGGLVFFGGLQVGLATAAAVSASGLFAILQTVPGLEVAMLTLSSAYLLYLAYTIATAPVGGEIGGTNRAASAWAGLLLGLSNPKAYVVFISLFSSFVLVPASDRIDAVSKWLICVLIILAVDIVWLGAGVRLGRVKLSHRAETCLNWALALAIVAAMGIALLRPG